MAACYKAPWITAGMSLAVIALSALGAWIGIKISKELKKSGSNEEVSEKLLVKRPIYPVIGLLASVLIIVFWHYTAPKT